jgi:hypothetical protein
MKKQFANCNLAMALCASLSKSFAAFASSRHFLILSFLL